MDWIANPDIWISLVTLTALEIVLGIDNLVVIAVLSGRLPEHEQPAARRLGLIIALVTRLALLFALTWLMGLTRPLVVALGEAISIRDVVLMAGGLFLIAKATFEIHHTVEEGGEEAPRSAGGSMLAVAIQIGVLDIVFSFDSVITAVGMAQHIEVMVAAIVLAMAVMLAAAGPVSRFVAEHPTIKMLALSFLVMIGVMLVAEGVGFHIPKGYIYFAMAFSCLVEGLNLLVRRRRRRLSAERAGG
jgi:predicted tellurium resistance membrane protein TerC